MSSSGEFFAMQAYYARDAVKRELEKAERDKKTAKMLEELLKKELVPAPTPKYIEYLKDYITDWNGKTARVTAKSLNLVAERLVGYYEEDGKLKDSGKRPFDARYLRKTFLKNDGTEYSEKACRDAISNAFVNWKTPNEIEQEHKAEVEATKKFWLDHSRKTS